MNDLEYCRLLSIETTTLKVWVEERWIVPGGTAEAAAFEEADVARGRLILDLIQDMGVNQEGVDVVIDLVDQVNTLRERMALMMDAIRQQDADVQRRLHQALRQRRR